jgi:hypothetical protein
VTTRLVLDKLDLDFSSLATRLRIIIIVIVIAVVLSRALARVIDSRARNTGLRIRNAVAGGQCGRDVGSGFILWWRVIVFGHLDVLTFAWIGQ